MFSVYGLEHLKFVVAPQVLWGLVTTVCCHVSKLVLCQFKGEGFHVNVSRISGNSQENQVIESPAMTAEMQRDYEEKIKEQEKLNKEFEKELEKRTEAYRKQQEAATEQIRKQLEQQHLKDVAFRQELVEVAIENQKKQVDIEVRYAKRDLDHQRKMAKDTLERTKFSQEIQVTLDTAAGSSVSGSSTHVEKRKEGHQAYWFSKIC